MVESDHGIAAGAVTVHRRPIYGDDVEFAVVVAIDEPDSPAHRFHDVALFRRRKVAYGQAGLFCDVLKTRRRLRRCGCLSEYGKRKKQADYDLENATHGVR